MPLKYCACFGKVIMNWKDKIDSGLNLFKMVVNSNLIKSLHKSEIKKCNKSLISSCKCSLISSSKYDPMKIPNKPRINYSFESICIQNQRFLYFYIFNRVKLNKNTF